MSLAQHRRYRRRLLQAIARRSAMRDTSEIGTAQLAREIERYLKSHAVQSVVQHSIWCRKHEAAEADALWRDAQRTPVVPLDYRRSRNPPVPFYHKARATSGHRKICVLPPILKMWQAMAGDLIVAQHRPRPHIGDWPGRGRDWQMGELLKVLTSPDQRIICADIRHAFASVNSDVLYELPFLPEQLMRRTIDSRHQHFVRRERSGHPSDVSLDAHDMPGVPPSGLMEGSPASNAIFSVLLDDLPDHLGEGISIFVYCDNVIIVAPTIEREWEALRSLVRYFTGHRAGPFEARYKSGYLRDGFDHLGYRVIFNEGEGVKVGLPPANWRKLEARLDDENRPIDETIDWLLSSFGHCSGDDELRHLTGRPARAA